MEDIIYEVFVIKKDGRTFFTEKNFTRDKYYVNGREINCRFQNMALEVPAKSKSINEFSKYNSEGFYVEEQNSSSAATVEQYYMYLHLKNEVINVEKISLDGEMVHVNGKIISIKNIIQTTYFSSDMLHLGTVRGFCNVVKHEELAINNYVATLTKIYKDTKGDKKTDLITKSYQTGQRFFKTIRH